MDKMICSLVVLYLVSHAPMPFWAYKVHNWDGLRKEMKPAQPKWWYTLRSAIITGGWMIMDVYIMVRYILIENYEPLSVLAPLLPLSTMKIVCLVIYFRAPPEKA